MTSRIAFANPLDEAARQEAVFTRPSFEEVYQHTFTFVWRTVRRLGVSENARDDVVQEIFLTVYRKLNEFEGRSSVKTWVFNLMMNVVRNYRRSRRRKGKGQALSAPVVDPAVLTDATADPSELASREEAGRIVHTLLEQLTEEKAIVFVMAELEGMTVPEIAELVNANLNTVYSRLRAARREFNEALARMHAAGGSLDEGSGGGAK